MIDIWTHNSIGDRFRLLVFKPLSTIFYLDRGGQLYWWSKLEYPQKTNDLSLTNLIT